MKHLQNKRIVIIGGTSGIGSATARILVAEGAEVIIAGRNQHKLEQASKQSNVSPFSQTVDASSRHQLDAFFRIVGDFDHLILTLSGGKGAGAFKELNLEDLRTGFEEKFWPQLHALQAALPYLKKTGSATLITAISATSGKPGFSGLAAINGSIELMIPVLAKELHPLRINAISPGVIDTAWWDSFSGDVKRSLFGQFAKETLVGRIGTPEEIGRCIRFMLEQEFVTGRILQVDGGYGL